MEGNEQACLITTSFSGCPGPAINLHTLVPNPSGLGSHREQERSKGHHPPPASAETITNAPGASLFIKELPEAPCEDAVVEGW